MPGIPAREPEKRFVEVLGRQMAYIEQGAGDPVVFQHGNPTSSYLWRNVIGHLADRARCIAIDMIGMGDSDKLPQSGPDSYRFIEHRRFFDAALATLGVEDRVTFVLHDWGSALGFDWAFRNAAAVRGLCYMEAIVAPLGWSDFPETIRPIFKAFRSPAGEEMVLEKNIFVDRVLPDGVLRGLTEEEMEVYRRPYLEPGESRRPTLTWPREIPFDGEPSDVDSIVGDYSDWLIESHGLPKLFINAEPGVILTGRLREFCRSWPDQAEITVKGAHFIQEDSPQDIGEAIAQWYAALP